MREKSKPMGHTIKNLIPLLACLFMFGNCAGEIGAQEFKIESQTYFGDSLSPAKQATTLFADGLVYEFLADGNPAQNVIETTIYESKTKRVVLLDPRRQAKLEMIDVRLLKMVDGLRRELAQNKSAQFLVNEEYTEESDLSGNWIKLSSPSFTFRIQGERPANLHNAVAYFEYLDNFARIPASDPRAFAPFPKMKLNESIKRAGWIPNEIRVEAGSNIFFKNGLKQTSKLTLIEGLSAQDRDRIAAAKRDWMNFQPMSLIEYRGLDRKAEAISRVAETTNTETERK